MEQNLDFLDEELFTPIDKDAKQINKIVRPSLTYWQDAWMRLKKNKIATLGLLLICIYIMMAIIGPYMSKYDFKTNYADFTDQGPSRDHWFGTDTLGRDLWARTWMGARVSLSIGFLATFINSVVGVIIGGVSGYFGGTVDMIIMRIIDVLYGIPTLIVAILVMVVMGSGIHSLILAMVIIGWIGSARFVRGQVLQLKNQEFVLAAKALGASDFKIIIRHLIPNMLGLIITNLTMAVPGAIFTEAFLSYIGLGIQPPYSSWGLLAREGAQNFRAYPYQLIIPSFFISTTMLSLNLLGDGLRDALDPRLRGTFK
ncbi:ABC transporter permease [Thermoanaerobacterium sp. DL9XJH110]|uniref:ABC transporter permease n=1 Tax=Thermoanaerobacterium sp. DL9XJH110 TaxID=3386643 RepID=UPI003BB4EB7F